MRFTATLQKVCLKDKMLDDLQFKLIVMVLCPKNFITHVIKHHILALDGITLSNTVRNLGVVFDQDVFYNVHIKQIRVTACLHLGNIS